MLKQKSRKGQKERKTYEKYYNSVHSAGIYSLQQHAVRQYGHAWVAND